MTPKSITLRSFKCFAGEVTFDFPTNPGLYLVQGRNELQPLLEGNGCGKSTLFGDAITWALFGKTPRLLKAGDILNWETTGAGSVYFKFEANGEEYAVLRTQTPNALCLDFQGVRQNVTQDQINALLGLDFDSFISSIVFAQFGTMFFDLSATDKSALLSSILDLSVWDRATDEAKKSVTQLESALSVVLRKISNLEGQVEGLNTQDFAEQIDSWEQQRQQNLANLTATVEKSTKEFNQIKSEGQSIEASLKSIDESLLEISEIDQELANDLRKCEQQRSKLVEKQNQCNFELKNYTKEIEKFKKVDKQCPYCLQTVSKEHLAGEISKINKNFDAKTAELSSIVDLIVDQDVKISEIRSDLLLVSQSKADFVAEQRQILTTKVELKGSLAKINAIVQNATAEISKLENSTNPFVVEQKKQQKLVKDLKERIKSKVLDQAKLEKELHATQYWTKAFREVRLALISDVLMQLELEVNNKLFQLGLRDWRVLFSVEGLTKGGKIKKGFTVTILTPDNEEPVNWNAWSGGESQRLRLAGALGMADLITAKCPTPPQFEVFDEPSSYLSESGITSLLEILHDRARTAQKQIFLIDHRRLDTTKFDGIISVIKTSEKVFVESTFATC